MQKINRFLFHYQRELLASFLFLFSLLDTHSTILVLQNGGIEANPIMSFLISTSPILFVVVRMVLIPFVLFLILSRIYYKNSLIFLGILILIWGHAIVNNYTLLGFLVDK